MLRHVDLTGSHKNCYNFDMKETSSESILLETRQPYYATRDQLDAFSELKGIHDSIVDRSGDLWMRPSMATTSRSLIARILYWSEVYQLALRVPGVICEFGVHWGTTSALLTNLRALYEPYNHRRKLFLFDTFEGFPSVSASDGRSQIGDFRLPSGYAQEIDHLLDIHESLAPSEHIKKHKVYAGDVLTTVPKFLEENPEAIVALAVFDMDLYEPTKVALQATLPRLTKGSVLVFDELGCSEYAGETLAIGETLGFGRLALRRHPYMPNCAWAIWD